MEEKIFDGAFFAKLNTLSLHTNLMFTQGMSGPRKSSAKGSSVEFSDFREYILGDDIRRIDWNAYGRMDKLFIKQFMEEKEARFHIFLDCSRSMLYGEQKKSNSALQICAALSYMILNNLDRVSITAMKESESVRITGLTGRQAFMRLVQKLEQITFEGHVNLVEEIKKQPFYQRGVVILISDFLDQPALKEALRYLAYQKQEILLVQVLAQEEIAPIKDGTNQLIDMESKEEIKVTMTNKVKTSYEKTLQTFLTSVEEATKSYQGTYLRKVTTESLEQFIFECVRRGKIG